MRIAPALSPCLLLCASCAISSAGPAGGDVPPPSTAASIASMPADPHGAARAHDIEAPGREPMIASRPAVVVELFSSEGCSSCPPADAVLRDLAEKQPVEGVDVIALEMHVDYWNDLGWSDPFSSDDFTARQRVYGAALGDRSIYTPQMIVDGRVGFVGSQRGAATSAITRAAAEPKAKVDIARSGDTLSVTVAEMPAASPAAEVTLALAEEGLTSDVKRGENAGALLVHGPVVRAMKKLGTIASGATGKAFERSETLTIPAAWRRDRVRAVVLVQAAETRAILGAAWVSMK